MALKLEVKNHSMKELPESTVSYIVLIQRWANERGEAQRYEGTASLKKILPSNGDSVMMGEFHIGGHMHGTSERHVDQMIAWKVIIDCAGEKMEFVSSSRFDSLNKTAK